MPRRPTAQRVLAALVAPFALVVGTSSASALFRCTYDQVVRSACCCPSEAPEPSDPVSLERACCDVQSVEAVAADDARAQLERDELLSLRQALAAAVVDAAPPPPRRASLPDGPAPPESRAPLVLLKQSFLR
jgi:hypothetical protein